MMHAFKNNIDFENLSNNKEIDLRGSFSNSNKKKIEKNLQIFQNHFLKIYLQEIICINYLMKKILMKSI